MRGTSGGPSPFEARFRSRLRMTGETVVRVNVILRGLRKQAVSKGEARK
jgi:hypothetical protein